ncbi:zinc finger protein 551-like isoform X3 [Cydia pomonella]|uniref:zinc finger protein 551-like isoform X3 n=1 Tax=Cydia pomonella TaxID=82600 RepID=UPI002ADD5209|nr:zinc finger protein 551-like isoform X3 [Cydia pomonella]
MLALLMLNRMSMKRRSLRAKETAFKAEKKPDTQSMYCRTCLSAEELVAIFYSPGIEKKRTEELRLVTGLEIMQDDGLSQKMCTSCIEKMNNALQFRKQSRKAEKSLLNMSLGLKPKKKSISKATRKTVKIKSPKVQKIKQKIEKEELDFDCSYDGFQNDDDYPEVPLVDYPEVEEKPKIKQLLKKPAVRKRVSIPNAASYKCPTCAKEFRMKATYKAHMRFHTNYCVCEACGKRCRNNNQLQEHKRARHGLGRIHKCAYCEYSSATKEALTIHERRHTGERPYICDHCGASFHRRSNLVQHIAIHLPEKNFQCTLCMKREKSKKLLQVHVFKAHREKRYRYICPVCRDTFTRPGNVRQHLARSHGVPRADQPPIDRFQVHSNVAEEIPQRVLTYL